MAMRHRMVVRRPSPRNRPLPADVYAEYGRPVFFTVRADGPVRPFLAASLNDAVIGALLRERQRSDCALYAYCLMPDHLHLLVAPRCDGASVLVMLRRFKGISTRVAWSVGARGRLWQPRCYDRVLRRDEAVERVAQYILDNPVRRGFVTSPDEYPWCGLVDPIPL